MNKINGYNKAILKTMLNTILFALLVSVVWVNGIVYGMIIDDLCRNMDFKYLQDSIFELVVILNVCLSAAIMYTFVKYKERKMGLPLSIFVSIISNYFLICIHFFVIIILSFSEGKINSSIASLIFIPLILGYGIMYWIIKRRYNINLWLYGSVQIIIVWWYAIK